MLFAAAVSGCSVAAESSSRSSTIDTVGGVGELPGAGQTTPPSGTQSVGEATTSVAPPTSDSTTTTTINIQGSVGSRVTGNRVLMIGDSLSVSISKRYSNDLCDDLVPMGWQVELDAETSKFIDFGKTVLDNRLSAGWDAAILFLGNNYGYDKQRYQDALNALILRLYPRPTILLTTTLFRPQQQDVNDVIFDEALHFPNVTVIDWATISTDPSFTGADNLHLTTAGRAELAMRIATAMGQAPAQPGKCLATNYTDDSGGSATGPPGNLTKKKKTAPATPTPTTIKPGSGSTTPTTEVPTTTTRSGAGSTPTTVVTVTTKVTSTTQPTPTTQAPVTTQPSTTQPSTTQPTTTQPAPTTTHAPPPTTTQPVGP